jgi:hypothetical protein
MESLLLRRGRPLPGLYQQPLSQRVEKVYRVYSRTLVCQLCASQPMKNFLATERRLDNCQWMKLLQSDRILRYNQSLTDCTDNQLLSLRNHEPKNKIHHCRKCIRKGLSVSYGRKQSIGAKRNDMMQYEIRQYKTIQYEMI